MKVRIILGARQQLVAEDQIVFMTGAIDKVDGVLDPQIPQGAGNGKHGGDTATGAEQQQLRWQRLGQMKMPLGRLGAYHHARLQGIEQIIGDLATGNPLDGNGQRMGASGRRA